MGKYLWYSQADKEKSGRILSHSSVSEEHRGHNPGFFFIGIIKNLDVRICLEFIFQNMVSSKWGQSFLAMHR